MKKKSIKGLSSKKSVKLLTKRRSSSRSTTEILFPLSFRTIILWGSLSCLVFSLIFTVRGNLFSPEVAGIHIYRGMVAHYQATVSLPVVPGAVAYNIYYKQLKESDYRNAVRNIPASEKTYLISYLKNNVNYLYKISAINDLGAEFWWSPVYSLSNIRPM